MIDQILGRPSATLRRSQIFLVLFFWVWRLYRGDGALPPMALHHDLDPGPSPSDTPSPSSFSRRRAGGSSTARRRSVFAKLWLLLVGRKGPVPVGISWIGRVNERLKRFSPYQLVLGTLTLMYALRHLDVLFGVGPPEPLARLYSRSYYRATWVNTAFDAGFASAMTIRPKWLKDAMSFIFAVYYMVYHNEGDEVLRRFRGLCTVEMLRVTWEKTNNPYIRLVTWMYRPRLVLVEHLTIPRPHSSSRAHLPPVKAMLFFNGTREELAKATELVVDFPGGGFIAMGPECHEERLRLWAKRTGKPVLGVDYGKAPEYPYPWAIEEGFDAYRTLMETKGMCIGIKSGQLGVVLTGDSAGGNICTTIMLRILEHHTQIPRPVSIILAYPALDFNFTSWMSPANLRVLRTEQSEIHIPGLVHGKDHMRHKSPLSVVDDTGDRAAGKKARPRQKSWGQMLGEKIPGLSLSPVSNTASLPAEGKKAVPPTSSGWTGSLTRNASVRVADWLSGEASAAAKTSDDTTDSEEDDVRTVRATSVDQRREADKSLSERVKTPRLEQRFEIPRVESPDPVKVAGEEEDRAKAIKKRRKAPIGTRLTMTSRVGYFQDRVITPSMMRAMAILYIGPQRNPDFETDYYISPILSPPHLLAHFPPVYFICGERDPFVDDTVILAGKIREAKRRRRAEVEQAQQAKSAKFGEGLRMSKPQAPNPSDHILRETDEDWVQMRVIEGWGHGFMQMTSLMREVKGVMLEMADWIDESFVKAANTQRDMADINAAFRAAVPELEPILSPIEHLAPNASSHVKPTAEYRKVGSASHTGYPDLEGLETMTAGDGGENEGVIAFVPKNKRKVSLPPSKYNAVPRRPSKEALNLHRSNSAPKFDIDETGSSGEAVTLQTPPLGARNLPSPETPRGSGAFAFFGPKRTTVSIPAGASIASPGRPTPIHPSAFAPYGSIPAATTRRTSSSAGRDANKPTNSLVAAAVAGARAASPALAAAGLVPQQVENVSEAELFRRRRMEAVFGMGDTESAVHSEDEGDEGDL